MAIRERIFDLLTGAALVASIVTAVVVVRGQLAARDSKRSEGGDKSVTVADWERFIPSGRLIGSPDAPLKIVEFADFQCPACRALHGVLRKLASENPGKLAISYHYVPLAYHPMAYPAARAAECAAVQGKFEEYHDILFAQFDSLRPGVWTNFAQRVEVPNLKRFESCVAATDSVPRISADQALALDTLRIKGTPTTIVNGKMYSFAPTISELTRMIKEAR